MFQSTLPRGERHVHAHTYIYTKYVSIHAPTRGATYPTKEGYTNLLVSIHAPTRGATKYNNKYSIYIKSFNPRSHEGSDYISCKNCTKITCFNPRSHEGSDLFGKFALSYIFKFQSTLPRGERLEAEFQKWYNGKVSIHAPTRGATV